MSYTDCFWTATGDLDCHPGQFRQPIVRHAPHHLPRQSSSFGTGGRSNEGFVYRPLFSTVSGPQAEHNLGYQARASSQGTGAQLTPYRPPYTPQYYAAASTYLQPWQQGGGGNSTFNAGYGGNTYTSSTIVAYKLPEIMRELGQPQIYDPSVGGIAVWNSPALQQQWGGVFNRVEIHDETIPNFNPIVFNGHVYTWTACQLRPSFVRNITDLMPFVWYDRQKEQLVIRTDSLDHNLAALALIAALRLGLVSTRQARSYELLKKYLLSICPESRYYNRYCRSTYINLVRKGLLESKN